MYIVSGCLLGLSCRYDGGSKGNSAVISYCKNHGNYCIVCPEQAGGLKAPSPPAERRAGGGFDREGKDVTLQFRRGAEASYEKAAARAAELGEEIEYAILKANSPSCGSGRIYDGTFSKVLTDGDGCFAELLKEKGIRVITEKEI